LKRADVDIRMCFGPARLRKPWPDARTSCVWRKSPTRFRPKSFNKLETTVNIFMSIMDVFVNMMDRFDDWMGRRVRINAFFGYFQQRAGLFITSMSIDEATAEAAKFSCVALIFALISMSILTYFGHFLETTMLAMVAADCLFNIYSFRQGVSWMAKHSYWSPSSNSDFRSFFMILSFCSMLYVVALLLSLFGNCW
jgi:hypothetical protein